MVKYLNTSDEIKAAFAALEVANKVMLATRTSAEAATQAEALSQAMLAVGGLMISPLATWAIKRREAVLSHADDALASRGFSRPFFQLSHADLLYLSRIFFLSAAPCTDASYLAIARWLEQQIKLHEKLDKLTTETREEWKDQNACVELQRSSAHHARKARHYQREGHLAAAVQAQETACHYHKMMWDRLARLVGVE